MEVQGMLEVDLVTGTRGSNQYFPISAVVTEPSNVCIHTALHECILTICTSHAALSETRAGHCLCSHCSFKSQSSYWVNLDIKTKYTDDPKPLSFTSFRQLQVALL